MNRLHTDQNGMFRQALQRIAGCFGGSSHERNLIEEMRREIELLKTIAYRDELTGLKNRRGVLDEMGGFFKEALFAQEHPELRKGLVIVDFAIIFIDVDNFKSVNDTYGHDEGDRVLQTLARVVQENTREIDAVGRLGGEEFVVGLLGTTEDDAYAKAEKIRVQITKKVTISKDTQRKMTASIGVASLRQSKAQTLTELIEYADKAMYEAKRNRGKNNVVKHSEIAV